MAMERLTKIDPTSGFFTRANEVIATHKKLA